MTAAKTLAQSRLCDQKRGERVPAWLQATSAPYDRGRLDVVVVVVLLLLLLMPMMFVASRDDENDGPG